MHHRFLGLLYVLLGIPAAGSADCLRLDFRQPVTERLAPTPAPVATLACPPCSHPPVIDGELEETEWAAGTTIDAFTIAAPPTTARVCYDDKALYLGVRCTQPAGRQAEALPRARDSAVWHDDCIEIFIVSDPRKGMLYQFVVSATNSIYDARGGNEGYNPAWTHAVKQGDDFWTVEMAIPFTALDLPRPIAQLRFSIGRNGPGLGPRAWPAKYGDPTTGALILEGATPWESETAEATRLQASDDLAVVGRSLAVALGRTCARPGERWIEAKLGLTPTGALEQTRLEAALFAIGAAEPVETLAAVPTLKRARLLVDLRRNGLERARVDLRYIEAGEITGSASMLLSAQPCPIPVSENMRIPVLLDLPQGVKILENYPVTFGVPFAAGALWDPGDARVIDAAGHEVPTQTEVTGRWGYEGSIKWLRFDTLISAPNAYFVQIAPRTAASRPQMPLTVTEHGENISIDTGAARYVLGKGASPIREIHVGSHPVATLDGAKGLYLIDQNRRIASADADGESMQIEARGPLAACVRFEGFYRTPDGVPLARHVTRVELFAGRRFADVTHTFIITENTNTVWFREIGWELSAAPGADAQALFGTAPDDLSQWQSVSLRGNTSAYMIQDKHYLFAHGENHFRVAAVDGDAETTILEGEECGDGAAVLGGNGGVLVNCRDAARLHPKEFQVHRDRICLKLFSGRAGEELDFRPAALIKKWDLETWFDNAHFNGPKPENYSERFLEYNSNAAGWSRTHFLRVSPLPATQGVATAKRLAHLHSGQVYLHNDPDWIYKTEVCGRLYPRDPERFPMTERILDDAFAWWTMMDAQWGEHGFVDYFSGPHISYRPGKYALGSRYINCTYTLRHNLWLAYLRSGSRAIREFAVGTNRTQLDNLQSHWTHETVPMGMFRNSSLALGPVYWGERPKLTFSSSTNLDQYLNLYHLCGYRRAKDCSELWGEAIKKYWTPSKVRREMRSLMLLRELAQAYALTWDPDLKELADATTDIFADRESEVLLTKNRPYHSALYKTSVDFRALLDAWHILGQQRHYEMARRVAEFWWRKELNANGYGYNPPHALSGNFLYHETGDPAYAEGLATIVARHANLYRPQLRERIGSSSGLNDYTHASGTSFTFEVGYALDVLVRSNADREHTAAWFVFEEADERATLVAQKGDEDRIDFLYKTAADSAFGSGNIYVGILDPQGPSRPYDQGLNCIRAKGGIGDLRLAKDGPAGSYRLNFSQLGEHCLFANRRLPLVLHAPGYCWFPASAGEHSRDRYYVKLPENETGAALFFEGAALLFTPDGDSFRNGEAVSGWVDLPADRPGLWSFELLENRLVKTRNIPPVFALDPSDYFDPGLPWERADATTASPVPPADEVYVPGAIATPGNQALHVTRRRTFILEGADCLPFTQGTVEFFVKPYWGTFEVMGEFTPLATLLTTATNWALNYCMKPEMSLTYYTYSLFSSIPGGDRAFTTRSFRQRTFIESGRWIHVAWVWQMKDGGLQTLVFVDGKRGRGHSPIYRNVTPSLAPSGLQLGPTDAAYDELRISDFPRYTQDFPPPPRTRELEADEGTRVLCRFNGDLQCAGRAAEGVQARLE